MFIDDFRDSCLFKAYTELTTFEKKNPICKFLLFISGVITTILLSVGTSGWQKYDLFVSIILGGFIWYLLIYRYNFIDKIAVKTYSYWLDIISFILATNTLYFILSYYHRVARNVILSVSSESTYYFIFQHFQIHHTLILLSSILLGALSLYLLFLIWRKLAQLTVLATISLYYDMDNIDKIYLGLVSFIAGIGIFIVYNLSNSFYHPFIIDIFYGADTSSVISSNAYINVGSSSNGPHQLLFGLFALPFGILATVLSKLFYFIPNSYYIILGFLQIFVLSVSTVLLCHLTTSSLRDIKIITHNNTLIMEKIIKILFYSIVTCSFAYIVHSLVMEQFVITAFWLILFVYFATHNNKYTDITFVAAAGSTPINGVLFPFLSNKFNIKKYISVFFAYLGVVIISGQLPKLLNIVNKVLDYNNRFTGGDATIFQKIQHWLNFIGSCFLTPGRDIFWNSQGVIRYVQQHTEIISIVGLIICIILIIGFIINFNDRFTRLCAAWSLFSLILIGIVGFGYSEPFLYSILFSWAYTSLLLISLTRLLKNHPTILCILLGLIVISLIVVNIPALFDLISFGVIYYPV